MKKGFLYKITNNINGKVYIGISSNISLLLINYKYGKINSHVASEMKIFGKENFVLDVILEKEMQIIRSRKSELILDLISKNISVYNRCHVKRNSNPKFTRKGIKHTEEAKAKISIALKGKPKNKTLLKLKSI